MKIVPENVLITEEYFVSLLSINLSVCVKNTGQEYKDEKEHLGKIHFNNYIWKKALIYLLADYTPLFRKNLNSKCH